MMVRPHDAVAVDDQLGNNGIISAKVYIGHLSYDTMEGAIQNLFTEVDQLVEVFLPDDCDTGCPRGFALVEFNEDASVAEGRRQVRWLRAKR